MKNHIEFENTLAQFTMIAIEGNMDKNSDPFNMGGDGYRTHPVRLSDYWLCEVPVTQAVWEYVMSSNPSRFQGSNRPIERVSWLDIAEEKNPNSFLSKLNRGTEGERPEGTEYRLPTEAQWEYAARGGKYWSKYPFDFSGSEKLNEVGWYRENSHDETKPVGLKTPNLLGLYDMSGNVWEWCEDSYSSNYYEQCKQDHIVENPCNRIEGANRVRRGGGSFNYARNCRPTLRIKNTPSNRYGSLSFRLALVFSSV